MTRCPRCQRRLPPSNTCPEHGRSTSVGELQDVVDLPHAEAPPGWTLGRMLAIGGSAVVFELAGDAVLKWARWQARDMRARFAIEAEVLRAVGPPTTPKLYAHGTDAWPYIVMENVGGDTLAAWMSRTGARGGLGEVIAMLTRIASALGVVHAASYVHRDLKPENICISARGVRLLDFGLAMRLGQPASALWQASAGVVGTAHYIAPEQIRASGAVDQRADIYAFGVIAFEMLAGRPPFIGERRAIEYQHQVTHAPSVRETRDIPPELDELVTRCLAKQPDARPQSMRELQDLLARALAAPGTMRGVGGVAQPPAHSAGRQSEVALAWIVGGDPIAVTRAIAAVNGVVARQRGDGILAAFTKTVHDAPLALALGVCRNLVHERCRVVLHASTALVRRTASGKQTLYGEDVENLAWTPAVPFAGLVLTAAAAVQVPRPEAADVAGFFRESSADHTTGVDPAPVLVGREGVIEHALAALARPALVGIFGEPGAGKSRVLAAIADRLAGRSVIRVRARRRFPGDLADELDLRRADHRSILLVDDADQLSLPALRRLLDLPIARVLASTTPLFEVAAGTDDRIAMVLPALTLAEADALLRAQLRPARLLPDVLVERLALRGTGNPRILLALARDLKQRGALRRHAGSDEWYVAVDELDTLLAPPSAAWFAARAIEDLPREVQPILRFIAALGPAFCAEEVAHVTGARDARERLAYLATAGFIVEQDGWYELGDHALGDAIYHALLDERALVHRRALEFWLAHRLPPRPWTARLAFHAVGADDREIALGTLLALAAAVERDGDRSEAAHLHARARLVASRGVSTAVRDVLAAL